MPTRVMSVDARSIMRAGLQMICRAQDDLEFVGEAVDFASSYSVTQLTCPDVIVFDPGDDAVARDRFIEQTEGLLPDVGMLAFTRGDERTELTIKDMTGVVRGFVSGEAAQREILMAIRSVAEGKIFICHSPSPIPAPNMADDFREPPSNGSEISSPVYTRCDLPWQLIGRERDVLAQLGQGKTNQEVAKELFLSVQTISSYRRFLMSHNGLQDDADVIRFSRQTLRR